MKKFLLFTITTIIFSTSLSACFFFYDENEHIFEETTDLAQAIKKIEEKIDKYEEEWGKRVGRSWIAVFLDNLIFSAESNDWYSYITIHEVLQKDYVRLNRVYGISIDQENEKLASATLKLSLALSNHINTILLQKGYTADQMLQLDKELLQEYQAWNNMIQALPDKLQDEIANHVTKYTSAANYCAQKINSFFEIKKTCEPLLFEETYS